MTDTPQSEPDDQFLTITEASRVLGFSSADLRQGIACGLVPTRRDNQGFLRVHRNEVPADLCEQIKRAELDPSLQLSSLVDEVGTLREELTEAHGVQRRLEQVLAQQSEAMDRAAGLLESREKQIQELAARLNRQTPAQPDPHHKSTVTDSPGHAVVHATDADSASTANKLNAKLRQSQAESRKLESLLKRSFAVIEQSETQSNHQLSQLTKTTDKAMQLLANANAEAETAKADVDRLSAMMDRSLHTSSRLEGEIDQRNGHIEQQHHLMQRLIAVTEQASIDNTLKTGKKKSFWQHLWAFGRGI